MVDDPDTPPERTSAAAGPAAPGADVNVLGIEVTQAVQDLANSVSLIRGKTTIVRVYLAARMLTGGPQRVEGELLWNNGQSGPTALRSLNRLQLQIGTAANIEAMRGDASSSLNFVIPAPAVSGSSVQLSVGRLQLVGGADLSLGGSREMAVDLKPDVPLRVRVIGLRYLDQNNRMHVPSEDDFSLIRSWLGRAYPVAQVEWSQLLVDAEFRAPFSSGANGTVIKANQQIARLRAAVVASGVHPLTHYYGLVSDGAEMMRGRAFGIPATADPTVVASGPAGIPRGWNGDQDRSYADWYCGHELGHTFGRYHPGFPPLEQPGGQDSSDSQFPYPGGTISATDPRYFGFDIGDSALAIPMRSLSPMSCHDVMTYMPEQWLSAYTYEAIYKRLGEEAVL